MSLWKYLVLLGGIIGVVGFFLPFVDVHTTEARFGRHPSAFDLVRRLEGLDAMTLDLTKLGLADADAKRMATQAHDQLQTARTAASVIYAPAALLALLRADRVRDPPPHGPVRRPACRLILGGASGAVWGIFFYVARGDPHHGATMGMGANLLLASAAAGVIAGLGALIAPDRGL